MSTNIVSTCKELKIVMFPLLMLLSAPSHAADAKVVDLAAAYQPTWGTQIATVLNDVLPVACRQSGYEITLVSVYNPEDKRIEIILFGSRTTLDTAKQSADDFRSKAWPRAMGLLSATLGVTLEPDQYRITYTNTETKKALLYFENGKYTVP